jgi:predicted DNA-binding protein
MSRKVMLTSYVEPDQAERLRALSARTGVPQAVYIRAALATVLDEHEPVTGEWDGGFGSEDGSSQP